MRSLFLVTEAFGNVFSSIPVMLRARGKGDITVIALDFWAAKELRQKGIFYKTPNEYLDLSICRNIDAKAIEMARTWYEPLGDKLAYKDILLGEMAECDFGFLFIDALRSIEMATKILSSESPDVIFLPQRMPLSSANAVCYESLPKALHCLARLNDIPVIVAKPGLKVTLQNGIESLKSKVAPLVWELVTTAHYIYRSISLQFEARRENRIFFASVHFSSDIIAEMNKDKNICLSLNLSPLPRIATRGTRRKIKELRSLWVEFKRGKESNRDLIYKNVPLFEVVGYRFQQFFCTQARNLIEFIEWVDKIIHKVKPNMLVVMWDTILSGRTISRIFKLHKLPALVIQHGAVSNDMAGFHVMPLEAQKQAVWGDTCREWHIKRGRPPESQIVTGNPRFDLIASGYHTSRSRICHKLGLDAKGGIIVVATEWFAGISAAATIEAEEQFIRSTLKALKGFPQEQVVVKLHPHDHKKYRRIVSAIAEEESQKVTVTKDYLWELIAISDLVVVSNSTVGLEAMILDKPVLVVDFATQLEKIPYVSSGAALSAHKPEEIALAVKEILGNEQVRQNLSEARKRFVHEYAYIQDGKASKRVAELIGQMMGGCGD